MQITFQTRFMVDHTSDELLLSGVTSRATKWKQIGAHRRRQYNCFKLKKKEEEKNCQQLKW